MLIRCITHLALALLAAVALTHCTAPYGGQPMARPMMQQPQQGGAFMLGIDVLASRNFDLLRGKRVGLITNHTSYTSRGERTRVAMQRALGPGDGAPPDRVG